MKKKFINWSNCPTCGNCLCTVLWSKTIFYPKKIIKNRYECINGHKFVITFKL